jgi:hypothetical protein
MMSAVSSPGRKEKEALSHFVWLVAIAIAYVAMFWIPLPPPFKRQGISITDELILAGLLVLVYLTFRYQGRGARYLRFGLILVAFTLPLLRLWETAESSWNIVLGLLPWADATEYYFDVNRLLQGGLFSAISGRRPLFASLLAAILALSHQNLQITLVVFTVINALVVFLLVEEIHLELGPVSATGILFLSQLFYRPFVGTTLTEQLGYPLGILALIVLMRAMKIHKAWLFALGLMILTFALMIRAGAFFVLPVLMIFAVVHFGEKRSQYLKFSLLMLLAVMIPALANAWLGRTVALPGAVQFANFADTLYGQARGGVRWTQAAIDHPELNAMHEPARSQLLYRMAFEEMKSHPLGLARGALKAWLDFILPGTISAFGFLTLGNKTVDLGLQIVAILAFLAGLWLLWKNRGQPAGGLLLAFWVGIFLSIPFVPPIDAGIRAYAATAALLFLPVCLVFSPTAFKRSQASQEELRTLSIGIPSGLALLLVVVSLLGAPMLKILARPTQVQPVTCAADRTPISFRLNAGSYIEFSPATDGREIRVPIVPLDNIHKSFDDFPYSEFAKLMRKIKQPALLVVAADISTGRGMWVVAPVELKMHENRIISACAKPDFATYPVMYIESFEK